MALKLRHFDREEFKCKCCGVEKMDDDVLRRLDLARHDAGVPFVVSSGYRCETHNLEIGSSSSNHTRGLAADILCGDGLHRLKIVRAMLDNGFLRIGIGPKFIHCDRNAGPMSIWLY